MVVVRNLVFSAIFLILLPLVIATALQSSPNCFIEGTITEVSLREAYNESCVSNCSLSLQCCPTDMELIHPSRYFINLTVQTVSYAGGDNSTVSCSDVFQIESEKVVSLETVNALNGIPVEGKKISGVATSLFPSFIYYNLAENSSLCGDGSCSSQENFQSCPLDCPDSSSECMDLCGDGVCQQENCQGQPGCPCNETPTKCNKDCKTEGAGTESFIFGNSFWVILSFFGAILFILIGMKILKWLFWMFALLMVILAIIFWLVL